MGAEQDLPEWKPLSKKIYKLRVLTRELQRIQEQKTVVKNTLHARSYGMFSVRETEKRLGQQVKVFDDLIAEVKEAILKTVSEDEALHQRVEKICCMKGINVLTVTTLIAETNGFELVEKQGQLVSYAGYDVTENQSGKRAGKTRISKKGNARIRRALHMPAFNVVKYEVGAFKPLYDRLIQRGKTKMQAYVAVQKKLLVIIWTLWRKNEAFDPEYVCQTSMQMN